MHARPLLANAAFGLRECGHVGCYDQSPHRHATAHFNATRHPIIEGYDPPEGWCWCYVNEVGIDLPPNLRDRLSEESGPAYVVDLPVVGLWPCALAEQLHAWLDETSDRSFSTWAHAVSATAVEFEHKLGNIKTLDDLSAFDASRFLLDRYAPILGRSDQ